MNSSVPNRRFSWTVDRKVRGQATSDGAGVKLTRILTHDLQRRLDPFLMLDAFKSDKPDDYIGGFPDHPHRGFETITYMIAGNMRHQDSTGGQGVLRTGGVQWMTAGRGVIHSEMPEQVNGILEGFQLWLNLPSATKMYPAEYRDIPTELIPEFKFDSGQVRVISGVSNNVSGAICRPVTEPIYLDIQFDKAGEIFQEIPAGHNCFIYVYRGEISVGEDGVLISNHHMAILKSAEGATGVLLTATKESKVLLVAGKPLGQPIVQYGPFVMNTEDEIRQAILDYQQGNLAAC